MTDTEFDRAFEAFELETAYGEFIMNYGERPVHNGDTLIRLMEDLYMYEAFRAHMIGEPV